MRPHPAGKPAQTLSIVILIAASAHVPARATEPPPATILEAEGARIGEVIVRGNPVFDLDDPRENRRLYRLANRLHVPTREAAIRAQLLFTPGERFEQRRVEETERNLRSLRFLQEPEIRPLRYHDGVVDLEIRSRDAWTMSPSVSFGRSGGANHTGIEFEDTNFLGFGKFVQAGVGSDVDRTTTSLEWRDPNVFGSHWRSTARFADSTDGGGFELGLARPFYALDTRWSVGASALADESVERRYSLGTIVDGYRRDQREANVYGGVSSGLRDGVVHRWLGGFRYDSARFSASPLVPSTVNLPSDRVLSYPYVRFESLRDGYAVARNHDNIGRTEDMDFGTRISVELGWSSPSLGANRSALVFEIAASRGFRLDGGQELFFSSSVAGRFESGSVRDGLAKARARYFWRTSQNTLFYSGLLVEAGHALDADHDVVLGGDTGLRGYPLRYQAGNGRAVFTLEERVFTNWYPFNLFHVGGAAFVDVGRTWGDASIRVPDEGLLKDFGVGLRFGNSRSSLGNVIHLDFAFPLDKSASARSMQILIGTKTSF